MERRTTFKWFYILFKLQCIALDRQWQAIGDWRSWRRNAIWRISGKRFLGTNNRKCDFDFLTEWFYPVFRKTIFTGQYLDHVIEVLTGEPVNRSIPHIVIPLIEMCGCDWFKSHHVVYVNMQIVTGIEVNSEAYFPKWREYCPSAEGTRAIFPQLSCLPCNIAI